MISPDDGTLLITGASGFIGWHIARAMARAGWRVVGTCHQHQVEIPDVEMRCIDLADFSATGELVRSLHPAAVIHCAAATRLGWCEEHPAEARAAIRGVTGNLCAAIHRHFPGGRLIAFSTDLVFDGENAPYAEDDLPKPLSVYGGQKWVSEGPVRQLPGGVVLRSSLVYGPPAAKSASFLSWMVDGLQCEESLRLFEDEWRTPVLVDDLIQAVSILLAADAPLIRGQVFHAGGPDRLNRVEMGRAACRAFGLEEERILAATRSSVPGGDRRPRDVSLDSSRLRDLGWNPTPFDEGIDQCRNAWPSL